MQHRNLIPALDLPPDPELVPRRQRRTEQVRLVGVRVAVQRGVDGPADETQGGVEAGWKPVADGSVEVIAEEEVRAGDGVFEDDGEGDGVLVGGVEGVGEVGVSFGGVVGVAWFLFVRLDRCWVWDMGGSVYRCSPGCARRD